MGSSDRSRWWLGAEALVHAAVVVLPWSLEGALSWASPLLLGLGGGAFVLWLIGARRHHRRFSTHLVLWLPLAVLAVAVAQLVPLPPGVLGALSVPAAELRDSTLVPLGLDGLRPVSMDPPSTARAVVRLVGLVGLLATALQLGRLEEARRRLARGLALVPLSIAVVGYGHLIAGEDLLFGVHNLVWGPGLVTPFANTNHLAAFLAFGATMAIGLALTAASRDSVLGWGAVAFACGLGVFLSLSRGGIGSFAVTSVVLGVLVSARRRGFRGALPWVAAGAAALFAGAVALEPLLVRAETLDSVEKWRSTKVELWPMLASGVVRFWRGGLGVGAFELGFTRFQTGDLNVTYTHPENIVLQWAADLGLPLAAGLGALAVAAAVRLWRAARGDLLDTALFVGLLGLVLHDVFDFALEMNGVAAPAAVALGLLARARPRDVSSPRQATGRTLAGVTVALLALGAMAAWRGLPTHRVAEAELAGLLKAGASPEAVRGRALALIDRHPSDWVLYANAASDAAQRGDAREALAWANRVLFLHPAPSMHVTVARALLRLGRATQALGELRMAWASGDASSLELGVAVAAREQWWDRLVIERPGHLTAVYELLRRRGDAAGAVSVLDAAQLLPPTEAVGTEAAALRVRHEAELGEPRVALALLDALPEAERTSTTTRLLRVQLLRRTGDVGAAVTELERLQVREPANTGVGLELSATLAASGRPIAAVDALVRLRPFVKDQATRALLFEREGDLWASQDRPGRALEALQTASRLQPSRADLHYKLARVHERLGIPRAAVEAVRAGRRLDTPEGAAAADAWIQRLQASP